jgi:hypothetical protein
MPSNIEIFTIVANADIYNGAWQLIKLNHQFLMRLLSREVECPDSTIVSYPRTAQIYCHTIIKQNKLMIVIFDSQCNISIELLFYLSNESCVGDWINECVDDSKACVSCVIIELPNQNLNIVWALHGNTMQ